MNFLGRTKKSISIFAVHLTEVFDTRRNQGSSSTALQKHRGPGWTSLDPAGNTGDSPGERVQERDPKHRIQIHSSSSLFPKHPHCHGACCAERNIRGTVTTPTNGHWGLHWLCDLPEVCLTHTHIISGERTHKALQPNVAEDQQKPPIKIPLHNTSKMAEVT